MANLEPDKRNTFLPPPPKLIPAHTVVSVLSHEPNVERAGTFPSTTKAHLFPPRVVEIRNTRSTEYEISPCPFSQTTLTVVSPTTQTILTTRPTPISTENVMVESTFTTQSIPVHTDMTTSEMGVESSKAKRFIVMTFEISVISSISSSSIGSASVPYSVNQSQDSQRKDGKPSAIFYHPEIVTTQQYSIGFKPNQSVHPVTTTGFLGNPYIINIFCALCGGFIFILSRIIIKRVKQRRACA
jgi:hypothetical protein